MRRYWKLYCIMIGAYLRSRLQFRTNFIVGTTALFVKGFLEVVPMALLVSTFKFISDYSMSEMAFMFGLWNLSYAVEMLFLSQTRELEHMIRFGILDRYLVRPIPPFFQLLSAKLNEAGFGELLTSGLVLAFAIPGLKITWAVPKVLVLVLFIILGAVVHGALQLLVNTVCFWAVQNRTLRMAVNTFAFTFVPYPVHIFDRAIQFLITFVFPYAMIYFFAGAFLLEKKTPWFTGSEVLLVYPAITMGLGIVALAAWRRGLRNYTGTGG